MKSRSGWGTTSGLGRTIRDWTSLVLAVLGAVLGTVGFFQSRENTARTSVVEASKLLDDAWDFLGGEKGTDHIGSYTNYEEDLVNARRCIEKAKLIAPRYARVYTIEASLAAAHGQYEKSIALAKQALKLDPTCSAHNSIGWVRFKNKQWPEAILEFQRAIEIHPDDPVGWNNLSVALRYSSRFDEAEKACYEAIRVDSSYAMAYHNLAELRKVQGRKLEAATLQERANQLAQRRKTA